MNRIPKQDIYIIFEGNLEEAFLKSLSKMFDNKYKIHLVKADGKNNIVYKYRLIKKQNYSRNVKVMYDLDNVDNIESIIKSYKSKDLKILKNQIYFINPEFELLFILIKENKTPDKNYEVHIKRIYKIDNYSKTKRQTEKIVNLITKEEVIELLNKIKQLLSKNDYDRVSTNYDKLFKELFEIPNKNEL